MERLMWNGLAVACMATVGALFWNDFSPLWQAPFMLLGVYASQR